MTKHDSFIEEVVKDLELKFIGIFIIFGRDYPLAEPMLRKKFTKFVTNAIKSDRERIKKLLEENKINTHEAVPTTAQYYFNQALDTAIGVVEEKI